MTSIPFLLMLQDGVKMTLGGDSSVNRASLTSLDTCKIPQTKCVPYWFP